MKIQAGDRIRVLGGVYKGEHVAIDYDGAPFFTSFVSDDGQRVSVHQGQVELIEGPRLRWEFTDVDGDHLTILLARGGRVLIQIDGMRELRPVHELLIETRRGVGVHIGPTTIFLSDEAREDLIVFLERLPKAAEPETETETETETESGDLKPRGVKRQGWLLPFDALQEVLEAPCPHTDLALLASHESQIPDFTRGQLMLLAESLAYDGKLSSVGLALAIDLVVQVLEHGAAKYSPDNWRKAGKDLVAFRREYFSAIWRHLQAIEETDPDSGLPHRAHVVCSGLFWTWHEMKDQGRALGSGAFYE